ncbi:M20 family metallo-hydrolase [Methanococcus voltae]|uniref:Acetylornithine deacetylase or succinyl-diaminopimelate desuccinylase n=1 Tax=Methanococcus voltae (strain ATCC BAA-1334 / A3) TaxID=456320 RepID=D7DUB1_METV3|nr:M20 family metallo-hydrolase [Methanococcus voltae]MCS3900521.1 succinyl-diaminopimelate desuccinylase [Methanococcus voltae]
MQNKLKNQLKTNNKYNISNSPKLLNLLKKQDENLYKKELETETINIASNLIRINSVNPGFGGKGEFEEAQYILKKLNEYVEKYNVDLKIKEYNTTDNDNIIRPNIVVDLDLNKENSLTIISHMDIVPEGDIALWDTEPYEPVIKNGKIYGRGSEDNGKGIVSSFLILKLLLDELKQKSITADDLKYNLKLIFVADEENGSTYGIRHLLKYEDEIFKKGDVIIVPDFGVGHGNLVEIAEKQIMWIKFTITGFQCHGSTPHKGINAGMLSFLFGDMLYKTLYNTYNAKDDIFTFPYSSFEPTIVKNSVENANTIPGNVEMYFDCRVLPDYNVDDVLKTIDNTIMKFKRELPINLKYYCEDLSDNIEITYNVENLEKSGKLSENSKSVVEICDSIDKILNIEPELCGMGGGTVAAPIRVKGYEAVVWGMGNETAHQPNENVDIVDLLNMGKIYLTMMIKEDKN